MSNSLPDTDPCPARLQSSEFIVALGYTQDDGYIAIKRRTEGDTQTPIINGRQYVFITRANISMAWVNPEDVATVLKIRGGCCGRQSLMFTYANVSDARRWTIGGGR